MSDSIFRRFEKWFGTAEPVDFTFRPTINIDFEIARLDLQPGDMVVLKLRDRVPREALDHFRKTMMDVTRGHKCLILENGADLAILTAAEIEARSTAPQTEEDTA